MELNEFVAETLTQIIDGVRQAQEKLSTSEEPPQQRGSINPPLSTSQGVLQEKGYRISSHGTVVQNVDFDVAVTASEGVEAQAGAGILVAAIGLGAKGGTSSESVAVNRIKFQVQVSLPRQS